MEKSLLSKLCTDSAIQKNVHDYRYKKLMIHTIKKYTHPDPFVYHELVASQPLSSRTRFCAPTSSFSSFDRDTSTIVFFLSFVVSTRPILRDENDTESDEKGTDGLGFRVLDEKELALAEVGVDSPVSIEMTPSRAPYPRTRSSMRLRGCMRSKRSRKLSSRSR